MFAWVPSLATLTACLRPSAGRARTRHACRSCRRRPDCWRRKGTRRSGRRRSPRDCCSRRSPVRAVARHADPPRLARLPVVDEHVRRGVRVAQRPGWWRGSERDVAAVGAQRPRKSCQLFACVPSLATLTRVVWPGHCGAAATMNTICVPVLDVVPSLTWYVNVSYP